MRWIGTLACHVGFFSVVDAKSEYCKLGFCLKGGQCIDQSDPEKHVFPTIWMQEYRLMGSGETDEEFQARQQKALNKLYKDGFHQNECTDEVNHFWCRKENQCLQVNECIQMDDPARREFALYWRPQRMYGGSARGRDDHVREQIYLHKKNHHQNKCGGKKGKGRKIVKKTIIKKQSVGGQISGRITGRKYGYTNFVGKGKGHDSPNFPTSGGTGKGKGGKHGKDGKHGKGRKSNFTTSIIKELVKTCDESADHIVSGDTYRKLTTASLGECHTACEQDSKCGCFVFDGRATTLYNQCDMKGKHASCIKHKHDDGSDDGKTAGVCKEEKKEVRRCRKFARSKKTADRTVEWGVTEKGFREAKECMAKCESLEKCKCWEHDPTFKACTVSEYCDTIQEDFLKESLQKTSGTCDELHRGYPLRFEVEKTCEKHGGYEVAGTEMNSTTTTVDMCRQRCESDVECGCYSFDTTRAEKGCTLKKLCSLAKATSASTSLVSGNCKKAYLVAKAREREVLDLNLGEFKPIKYQERQDLRR